MPAADNRLPVYLTSFIGRTEELEALTCYLADTSCRLLSLVGPGGTGKTRTAVEAARGLAPHFADGIYFVGLTSLCTLEDVLTEIASVIGFTFQTNQPAEQHVLNVLRDMTALLVLDNCEHLPDLAGLVQRILETASGIKILATSRQVLNLTIETLYPLSGLAVPDDAQAENIASYSAVRLFIERARRIEPGFAPNGDVVHICRLVDGMPLAIELAVACLPVLSCAEIVAEIGSDLDILESPAHDIAVRHRSMRAVLECSWQLLTLREQTVFMELSVFRGGFTTSIAREVTGALPKVLRALVDKSLLRRNKQGRLTLHELVRQFAHNKLEQHPEYLVAACDRHCVYYTRFLEQRQKSLYGAWREVMEEVETEIDNIRACWSWAVKNRKVREIICAADALSHFFDHRGWYQEGLQFMSQATAALEPGLDVNDKSQLSLALAKALDYEGFFLKGLLRYQQAESTVKRSLAIFQELQYQPGIAIALNNLGQIADCHEDKTVSVCYLEQSLAVARACYFEQVIADTLQHLMIVDQKSPDGDANLTEAGDIYRSLECRWGIIVVRNTLAMRAFDRAEFHDAKKLLLDSYVQVQHTSAQWLYGETYSWLGLVLHRMGNYAEAGFCTRQLLGLFNPTGIGFLRTYIVRGLVLSARIAAARREKVRAVELLTLAQMQPVNGGFTEFDAAIDMEVLRQELSSGEFEFAVQRGQSLDLKTVMRELLAETPPSPRANPTGIDALTPREIEIIHLMNAGLKNAEIAEAFSIANSTAKRHVHNIFGKLGVKDRVNALIRARDLKLIE